MITSQYKNSDTIPDIGYSYNDFFIIPSEISKISHRSECNPFVDEEISNNDRGRFLPIFTAPMSTVVDKRSFEKYIDNKIIPIVPRSMKDDRWDYLEAGYWVALSLEEFKERFVDNEGPFTKTYRVLIDVANGHMAILYDLVKQAKQNFERNKETFVKLIVMTGNIANPRTYFHAWEAGVDYIRCGIGSGEGCITSSNLGIHYPMATLIDRIYSTKIWYEKNGKIQKYDPPRIIADGGIRNYDDVIKALCLGANYVMIGGLFSRLAESPGPWYYEGYYEDSNSLFRL